MSNDSSPGIPKLSERQLKDVLARAAAIDAIVEDPRFSAAEVSAIAQEARISRHAIERALAELPDEPDDQPTTKTRRVHFRLGGAVPGWLKRIGLAAGSLGAGLIARLFVQPVSGGASALIAISVIAGVALTRSLYHRRTGSFLGLQFELLQVWAGFTVGFYLEGFEVGNEPAAVLTVFWLAAAFLGGAFVDNAPSSVKHDLGNSLGQSK